MNKTFQPILYHLRIIGTLAILMVTGCQEPPIPDPPPRYPIPTPTVTPSALIPSTKCPSARPPFLSTTPTSPPTSAVLIEERFSSGDRRLFVDNNNPDADRGIQQFSSGNYREAQQYFTQAVAKDPNDPEVQIYLNNTKARLGGTSFILAAVVPATNRQTSAKEMLRGIAQAQTKFNEKGLNGRRLEIIIFNDSNDPRMAQLVAQNISNNSSILGVIGHNSSQASYEGLMVYERVGLAMISPTSSSTFLCGNSFLRTIPSDAEQGKALANYAMKNNLKKVIIFYSKNSPYSQSIKESFVNHFQGEKPPIALDISVTDFKPNEMVKGVEKDFDTFVLLPKTDERLLQISLEIADANSQLSNPKKLLGGDALYNPDTLKLSQGGVIDLVLVVPWFANQNYPFTNIGKKRWKGRVSWRTATSYDATQAFINAFSAMTTRNTVLTNLKQTNLPPPQTSGERLRFFSNGDRNTPPILVKVIPSTNSFAKYDFELINNK
ncbi:MAG: ABC transporter substrate-binding protein [Crocosphaera sp.]